MEGFNNICVMEKRNDGNWNPAVYTRYNYTKVDLLKEFSTVKEAVEFAKEEAKNLDVKLCVSFKYSNRPDTVGLL